MGAIMDEEREMVLRMLKEGKITVEEADALLQELVEPRPEDGGGTSAPPPSSSTGIPDVREELRSVFQDLMESIPNDVAREITHAREAFRPGFFQVMRGLRGLAEGRAETTAEEAMSAGEQVVVSNAWGDVVLAPAAGEHLRLRAVKRVWAGTVEEAQREAEALPVEVRRQAAPVEIDVMRPLRPHQRSRVDMHLAVPAGVHVRLDGAKGDVEADGLRGKLEMRIARGDVRIRSHEGAVALDVVSGDIQLGVIQGDVRLDVRSGDIVAREVRGAVRGRIIHGDISIQEAGDLSLDVVHGDVSASRLTGSVDVEAKSGDIAVAKAQAREVRVRTLSGDVEISLDELGEGPLTVETISGDIEVGLPASARATFEASTRSGSVHSALTLQQTTGARRSLRGVLIAPDAAIRLSATSGDIEIEERRA